MPTAPGLPSNGGELSSYRRCISSPLRRGGAIPGPAKMQFSWVVVPGWSNAHRPRAPRKQSLRWWNPGGGCRALRDGGWGLSPEASAKDDLSPEASAKDDLSPEALAKDDLSP